MARGKYLSLEEARKLGRLDRFCKEHPSEGDEHLWDELFEAMVKGPDKRGRERKTQKDA